MNQSRTVSVVTGSRADFGLLKPIIRRIKSHPRLQLRLFVTGSHFSAAHGASIREIEQEGFAVDHVVDVPIDDTYAGVASVIAETVSGVTHGIQRFRPDVLLLLGDRYEILAASLAASISRVPIAHIAGGDSTAGAYDEGFRHAISKLAHVHFATNERSAQALRAMGEEAWRVYVTGSPGIDAMFEASTIPSSSLSEQIGIAINERTIVVTYHPVTVAPDRARNDALILVEALRMLPDDVGVVVTGTNTDAEGSQIAAVLQEFCAAYPSRTRYVESLGQQAYVSLMKVAGAVVGNSSSGLYEAPSVGIPTVNIGERQLGRILAPSVIQSDIDRSAIATAITNALKMGRQRPSFPYGNGNASEMIVQLLDNLPPRDVLLRKAMTTQYPNHV